MQFLGKFCLKYFNNIIFLNVAGEGNQNLFNSTLYKMSFSKNAIELKKTQIIFKNITIKFQTIPVLQTGSKLFKYLPSLLYMSIFKNKILV